MQDATSDSQLRATAAGLDLVNRALALTSKPLIPNIERPAVQVLDSTNNALTEDQIRDYLEHCGVHCPVCLSPDISGGSVEVDEGEAWQNISCGECGAEWIDDYKLDRISYVTLGTKSTTGGETIE